MPKFVKMPEYAERDAQLARLGYKSYKAYLKSAVWEKIRRDQLNRKPECYGCGRKATQVHHKKYTYATLLGIGASFLNLRSVCAFCHFDSEYLLDGRKCALSKANERLGIKAQKLATDKNKLKNNLIRALSREKTRFTIDDDFRQRSEREE